MRKLPVLFVAALCAAAFVVHPASAGVFLSELCDPQNNYQTDRFIEIYNSGPNAVDLTNWKIIAVGNNVDVNTWPLSGTIAAGQAKVAGSTAPVTNFPIHFASASWLQFANYSNWNGKIGDGAKLVDNNNVVLDYIVATEASLFENKDLVRHANVTDPSPVYVASQWTATPVLLATDASPGTHNGSAPPAGGPAISNVVTDPASPTEAVPVDVQAAVVDTSGAIAAVTLLWGSSSGSLPNTIAMALLADSTYRTSAPIPGQTAGASVFYRVQADGASATTLSPVSSFTIPGGAGTPPSVLAVGEMSDSTLLVQFSEPVDEASAEVPGAYTVGALTGVDAVRDPLATSQVLVTIRNIPPGSRTLVVNGVSDLDGNAAFGVSRAFNYVDVTIPAGYYDNAIGLTGSALRIALHNIINNHTVNSYAFALTAFQTTDVKPNGKVWDMYSDVPGGTPPYEYNFDDTNQGATEGLGWNREHSWPSSWFNDASPMHSDLWILYPTDSKVNGYRANFPYGVVGSATTTSWNGSKVGPSVSPGYAGTVFEPIDAYKGDLARGQFYVATRYYNEDGAWTGSPSADGAEIYPWAVEQYSAWAQADPVSWKERMRNGAVYVYQHNRNPFVDHPEFLAMIYDSNSVVGVGDGVAARTIHLRQNIPNPFNARTTISFDLAHSERVTLRVYDVSGRLVATLADGSALDAGRHHVEWNPRGENGMRLAAGLYLLKLDAGPQSETRRMAFVR